MTRLIITIDMGDIDPATRATYDPRAAALDVLDRDDVRVPTDDDAADHPVYLSAGWVEDEKAVSLGGHVRCPACDGHGTLTPEAPG